jgi:hypothetical protein
MNLNVRVMGELIKFTGKRKIADDDEGDHRARKGDEERQAV